MIPEDAPSLAVVVPVWNDEAGLSALLGQIARLGVFSQVVVVDDASDRPADPLALGWSPERLGAELVFLRNSRQRGAGYARNRGLQRVTAERVLFFDSDDRFTEDFAPLCAELAALPVEDFDFCLFSHAESSHADSHHWGPLKGDQVLWERAGVHGALAVLPPAAIPHLIQIIAYPWNKIYRTSFLIEKGLRCTETFVHNDIELHWKSFLSAGPIRISDRRAALHRVGAAGQRLTNRAGAERLDIFEALDPVAQAVTEAGEDFALPFARFAMAVLLWGEEQIDPYLRPVYQERAAAFLASAFGDEAFRRIAVEDPELAERIIRQLAAATGSLSLILVDSQGGQPLERSLASAAEALRAGDEVIVVETAPGAPSAAWLRSLERGGGLGKGIGVRAVPLGTPLADGRSAAVNLGLDAAQGDMVMMLESGDILSSPGLGNARARFHKEVFSDTPPDLLFGAWEEDPVPPREENSSRGGTAEAPASLDRGTDRRWALSLEVAPWRMICRRSFLEVQGLRLPGEPFGEITFHWQLCRAAKRVLFTEETLCRHARPFEGEPLRLRREAPLLFLAQYERLMQDLSESDAEGHALAAGWLSAELARHLGQLRPDQIPAWAAAAEAALQLCPEGLWTEENLPEILAPGHAPLFEALRAGRRREAEGLALAASRDQWAGPDPAAKNEPECSTQTPEALAARYLASAAARRSSAEKAQ